MGQRIVKVKGDADKGREELIVELVALRDHNSRLKEVIRCYEKVAGKNDVFRSSAELEARKDSIQSLNDKLLEQQKEVDLQGEELAVQNEELRSLDFHADGRDATINVHEVPHFTVEGSDLLRDVFYNLVSNAVKHSRPDRPLNVDVGVERVDWDGRAYYRCAVEDDGPGVPDGLKPQLFHRFQRGKTRAHGKGLGLYLVRTLVEGYGGSVWVEDRVKGDHTKGARFVVILPSVENN